MNKEEIRNAKNFDELLDIKYGKTGTERRDIFEEKAQYFVISEMTLSMEKRGLKDVTYLKRRRNIL